MKPWKYYTTINIPVPSRDEHTNVFVYKAGQVVYSGPYLQYKARAHEFSGMLVEKVVNEAGYKAQREQYGFERSRLEQEFKADLLEEHGVTSNPKANRCYGIAYEECGHAGFEAIATFFDLIVELIK